MDAVLEKMLSDLHKVRYEFESIDDEIEVMEAYNKESKFALKVIELEKSVEDDFPTWTDDFGIKRNEITSITSNFFHGFSGLGKRLVSSLKSFLYEYDVICESKRDCNNPKAFSILSELEEMIK